MRRWTHPEARAYRAHQTALQATRDGENRTWILKSNVGAPDLTRRMCVPTSYSMWVTPEGPQPSAREDKHRMWRVGATTELSTPPAKKAKGKKDPNAPKQGLSSFMLFSKDERPKVCQGPPPPPLPFSVVTAATYKDGKSSQL